MSSHSQTEKALNAAVETFTKSDDQDRKTAGILNDMLDLEIDEVGFSNNNKSDKKNNLFVDKTKSKPSKHTIKSTEEVSLEAVDPAADLFKVNHDEDGDFLAAVAHYESKTKKNQNIYEYDGIVDADDVYTLPEYTPVAKTTPSKTSSSTNDDLTSDSELENPTKKTNVFDCDDNDIIENGNDITTSTATSNVDDITPTVDESLDPLTASKNAADALKKKQVVKAEVIPEEPTYDPPTEKIEVSSKPFTFGGFLSSFKNQFVEAVEDTLTFIATGKDPTIRPMSNRLRRKREEPVIRLLSDVFALADDDKDGKITKEETWDLLCAILYHAKARAKNMRIYWDDDEWESIKIDYADVLSFYPNDTLTLVAWIDYISELELDNESLSDVLKTVSSNPIPKVTSLASNDVTPAPI